MYKYRLDNISFLFFEINEQITIPGNGINPAMDFDKKAMITKKDLST